MKDKRLGSKIKDLRFKKGMSQEELADASQVSLRTIQRIENNENEPRGKTMQLICEALHVNIEELLDYGKYEDRQFLMLFHLSVLSTIVVPFGNIFLPLILWLTNKQKIKGLQKIGARLLNFQIVFQSVTFILSVLLVFGKLYHWFKLDLFSAFFILLILLLLNLAAAIIFAVQNYRGKQITYPSIIPLIK